MKEINNSIPKELRPVFEKIRVKISMILHQNYRYDVTFLDLIDVFNFHQKKYNNSRGYIFNLDTESMAYFKKLHTDPSFGTITHIIRSNGGFFQCVQLDRFEGVVAGYNVLSADKLNEILLKHADDITLTILKHPIKFKQMYDYLFLGTFEL